ncbi:hypothetical protein REPUB_Repub05bG0089000 [Reevesia pubescens]
MTIFALAIYGLVVFPIVKRHVKKVVVDFLEEAEKNCNPTLGILVETIRLLNFCRRNPKSYFVSRKRIFKVFYR